MKIAYKISNAVAVLAIFPTLIFLPILRFIAVVGTTSDSTNPFAGLLTGAIGSLFDINSVIAKITGIDIENLPEFYSAIDLYDMFGDSQASAAFAGFNPEVIPKDVRVFLTMAVVCLALSIVLSLATMIAGFFAKKITVPVVTSALALVSAFGAKIFFGNVTNQLVSGKLAVTTLLKGVPSLANYQSYLKYLDFDIRILELSHAFTVFMVLLVLILALNIGFRVALSLKDA